MTRRALLFCAATLLAAVPPALAQAPGMQDSTLNNLQHAPGYVTATPGTLPLVIERGTGKTDMVLVSGFGLGASVFDGFMRRNAGKYRMFAVTLPGFEGTAAPPMPDSGTSYGAQTWTRQATDAVAKLITDKKLNRPVLVGHYLNGTQVAMRVALEHPEMTRGVVLLSGTPRYEPNKPSRFWPQNLTLDQKVKAVDQFSAPRWFKTVTRTTWVNGNFKAADFSTDTTRGKVYADRANEPLLPVLVRWLCEFHASDLWPELDQLKPPLLVVRPGFTPGLLADTTKVYLTNYFEGPWVGRLEKRPNTETLSVADACILVMDDQPAIVDRKVAEFVKRTGK